LDLTAEGLHGAVSVERDGSGGASNLALALILEGAESSERGPDLRDGPADPAGLGAPLL